MMVDLINKNYKDLYDFFYLPIDLKVGLDLAYRTTATWVTPSSTSCRRTP